MNGLVNLAALFAVLNLLFCGKVLGSPSTILWVVPQDQQIFEAVVNVGDTIAFDYNGQTHNLFQMPSLNDMSNCNFVNATELCSTSDLDCTYQAEEEGEFYFACSVGQHCNFGQQLILTVSSDSPSMNGTNTTANMTSSPTMSNITEAPTISNITMNATSSPTAETNGTASPTANLTDPPVLPPSVPSVSPTAAPTRMVIAVADMMNSPCIGNTVYSTEDEALLAAAACGCSGTHQMMDGSFMIGSEHGQCQLPDIQVGGEISMSIIDDDTAMLMGTVTGLQENCLEGELVVGSGFSCVDVVGFDSPGDMIHLAPYTTNEMGEAEINLTINTNDIEGFDSEPFIDIYYLVGHAITLIGCTVMPSTSAPTTLPTMAPIMNTTAPSMSPTENLTTSGPTISNTNAPTIMSMNDTNSSNMTGMMRALETIDIGRRDLNAEDSMNSSGYEPVVACGTITPLTSADGVPQAFGDVAPPGYPLSVIDFPVAVLVGPTLEVAGAASVNGSNFTWAVSLISIPTPSSTLAPTSLPSTEGDNNSTNASRLLLTANSRDLQETLQGFIAVREGTCENPGDFFDNSNATEESFWINQVFSISENQPLDAGTIDLNDVAGAIVNESAYVNRIVTAESMNETYACGVLFNSPLVRGIIFVFPQTVMDGNMRILQDSAFNFSSYSIIATINGIETATGEINITGVANQTFNVNNGVGFVEPIETTESLETLMNAAFVIRDANGFVLSEGTLDGTITPTSPPGSPTATPSPSTDNDNTALRLGLGLGLGLGIPLLLLLMYTVARTSKEPVEKKPEGASAGTGAGEGAAQGTEGQSAQETAGTAGATEEGMQKA